MVDSLHYEIDGPCQLDWSPYRQRIVLRDSEFTHDGPIKTDPSHDLVHLIVGVNGGLPWLPQGEQRKVKLAEYNAVFLEHLLNNLYNSAMQGTWDDYEDYRRTALHARWFVENHFAPFPVMPEEAYYFFCDAVHPVKMLAMSMHYFSQKNSERQDPNFRTRHWTIDLTAIPAIPQTKEAQFFTWAVMRNLLRMKGDRQN